MCRLDVEDGRTAWLPARCEGAFLAHFSPDEFVKRLDPALREAAAIARGLEGRVRNCPKESEATAVKQALTAADTAAQETILEALVESFPDVRLEAEEDTPLVARFPTASDSTVIIDPIDGTLHAYLEASGPYSVIVGLAKQGVLQSGLVGLPREGLFFAASRGGGAGSARAGDPLRAARVEADGSRILVSHNLPAPAREVLCASGFEVVPASGGAVAVAPLITGVRAGLRYASGELGISVRGRVGALIAAESGASVQTASGAPFPLDLVSPAATLLVAADTGDLELLREALRMADLA